MKLLKLISSISIVLIVAIMLASCNTQHNSKENTTIYSADEIGNLAYNNSGKENIIYLLEENKYTPYIVITNDYNGKTLLLRKYVLDYIMRYSEYSAYYKSSEINLYLNSTFLDMFDQKTKELIEPTCIKISSKENFELHGKTIETFNSNAFLLSFEELNYGAKESNVVAVEGVSLEYFNTPENRLAQNAYNEYCAYWTRSADTGYNSCVFIVGRDGKTGSVNSYDNNGIRPALCINGHAKIVYKDNNISGYVLK